MDIGTCTTVSKERALGAVEHTRRRRKLSSMNISGDHGHTVFTFCVRPIVYVYHFETQSRNKQTYIPVERGKRRISTQKLPRPSFAYLHRSNVYTHCVEISSFIWKDSPKCSSPAVYMLFPTWWSKRQEINVNTGVFQRKSQDIFYKL